MSDAEHFHVAIGHAERGSFSIEEVKAFIDASIRRFPDRKPLGIKASHAVIQNGLGERYRDLGVSPQLGSGPVNPHCYVIQFGFRRRF